VVHHNPRIDDPKIYQSATYLAYKVVSKIMDITDDLWVAATGAVADYDLTWSGDVMDEAKKKWGMEVFHKVAAMLESARVTKIKTCEQIVNLMIESPGPDEILEDQSLLKAYNEINADIEVTVADAEATAEHIGDVILYNINSKYHINSIVSTKLSEKWHDKLLIIWSKSGKSVSGSVRNQDKNIDANKVLRAAAREIRGASAGGHEAAAGFTVPAEDWDTFRKNVIEIVQKRQ
jgi:alanyl-tRNA synthetase